MRVPVTPHAATPGSASPPAPWVNHPQGHCKNNTSPFTFAFLPEDKALGHPALVHSGNRYEGPQQPGFPHSPPKASLARAAPLLVPHSLKRSAGNLCRREQTAEGEGGRGGFISPGKELHNEQAEQSPDTAGLHNWSFTVQEITFLTRALLGLLQLALLSITRGLTVTR